MRIEHHNCGGFQVKNKQVLFYPGDKGSKAYRIPSLICTNDNILIAANDARLVNQNDNPNQINNVIRRSYDNGQTWTESQTTVAYIGDEGEDGPAAIDIALLNDQVTNTVWGVFNHTPGGVGWYLSQPGTGYIGEDKKLIDGRQKAYRMLADGRVQTIEGEATDYRVNQEGYVYLNEERLSTIYAKFDSEKSEQLFEMPTSFLQLIKSEDGGVTWSEPINLNLQVKEEWMSFIGSGPGIGIQLQHGKHRGRLIFPIYYTNELKLFSCAVIYSDDHGQTWQRGESPNDGRLCDATFLSAEHYGKDLRQFELTESQVIERENGDLVVYMRNHSGKLRVAKSVSHDGGQTWSQPVYDETLVNPVCQFSLLKVIDESQPEKEMVLFLGPNSETERAKGTLRLSEDGGETWITEKLIEPGSFVYSCMTQLADGTIGILYETESDQPGLLQSTFVTIELDELTA